MCVTQSRFVEWNRYIARGRIEIVVTLEIGTIRAQWDRGVRMMDLLVRDVFTYVEFYLLRN